MRPLKIHVPNPCTENWNKMLPTQQGRICTTCSTEVTDFTKFTNEELKAWLNKVDDKRVCGNFRKFQLEDFNRDQGAKRSWFSISSKLLVASCLTLFVDAKANAASKLQQNQFIYQKDNVLVNSPIINEQKAVPDSLITLTGIVKSADDNLPLPNVWVGTKDGKISTITDSNGRFVIKIKSQKTLDLVFKYIGMENFIERVYTAKNTNLQVSMKSSVLLGELVVSKPSKFTRAWSSIKRAFK